ncbi:hypothetical protein [Selenomonas ruminantium]|uniref:hypothetical protein n=1 Tax=Selenomonas ruminantium TaxID=971 RepID=UPI0009339A7D|nr:hypothetical protein [Selenomonas ruminantium]
MSGNDSIRLLFEQVHEFWLADSRILGGLCRIKAESSRTQSRQQGESFQIYRKNSFFSEIIFLIRRCSGGEKSHVMVARRMVEYWDWGIFVGNAEDVVTGKEVLM